MTRSQVISWIKQRLADSPLITEDTNLLVVDAAKQRLGLLSGNATSARFYAVSTAKNGLGNRDGSYQTPLGVHRIAEKIGAGEQPGTVFKGRKPSGEMAQDMDNQSEDQITSRILWLEGLEPGFNRGEDCDSYHRYIYIHGTSDEQRIGQPVSAGCVRMRNRDVVELFDVVKTGDLVLIQAGSD